MRTTSILTRPLLLSHMLHLGWAREQALDAMYHAVIKNHTIEIRPGENWEPAIDGMVWRNVSETDINGDIA